MILLYYKIRIVNNLKISLEVFAFFPKNLDKQDNQSNISKSKINLINSDKESFKQYK